MLRLVARLNHSHGMNSILISVKADKHVDRDKRFTGCLSYQRLVTVEQRTVRPDFGGAMPDHAACMFTDPESCFGVQPGYSMTSERRSPC